MVKLNKIVVASEMYVEAHNRFSNANSDIDYITSILLSGSIIGIVGELLKEQGGKTTHQNLARMSNFLAEDGDGIQKEGFFRAVYNSLKHAGYTKRNVKASDDLLICADLRLEAARMLDAAKSDFNEIKVSFDIKSKWSSKFISLLESIDSYE